MNSLWLAYLTIREALFKGTLLFFFVISNLIILFFIVALGSTTEDGTTSLTLFGNIVTPRGIPNFNPAEFLFLQLFNTSTFWVMLFGIFATAGMIPSMLDKGTVELYLSKPLSRTQILIARSVGACGGIGINLLYFAAAIWLTIGLKTGLWHHQFLLASLMTLPIFFFYYSIVALIAVMTRSTGFSIMFALIFWLFTSMLQNREMLLYPWWDNAIYRTSLDAAYYATPQISQMIESAAHLIGSDITQRLSEAEEAFSALPFFTSALSAGLLYGLSSWYFSRQDY